MTLTFACSWASNAETYGAMEATAQEWTMRTHKKKTKKYDFWKCENKFTASQLQHLLPHFVATKHQTLSTNSVKYKSQTPLKDKTQRGFLVVGGFFWKGGCELQPSDRITWPRERISCDEH